MQETSSLPAKNIYNDLLTRIRAKVSNTVFVFKYQANQSDPNPGEVMSNVKVYYDAATKVQHWYNSSGKCFKTIKVGI